jgi:hypothetical protein
MQLVEVVTPTHKKQFLDIVDDIYRGDQNYIRPLNSMVDAIFDPAKNRHLEKGKAVRYLLFDGNAPKPIGRIAAFVNANKAYGYEQPTGGIGFFECVDSQDAAFMLFDHAKQWLAAQGMEAMDGPINFGENDNFWGLLVDGFTPPAFGMPYNPPYYRPFFEAYGFGVYFEQITNHLDLVKPFPERFWRIAERIVAREGFEFKHFDYAAVDKFVADAIEIHNDAWRFHESFSPLDRKQLLNFLNKAKPFLQPDLIWFAYYNGEPIAFLVMFPDVNQILRHFNGHIGLWGKLKFWWLKRNRAMTRTRVTALGVKPHYQRLGVESGMFYQLRDVVARNPHITEMELSWVGDFNPKMRALQEAMESVFGKKHITYRYLFGSQKRADFHRSKTIPVDTKSLTANKMGDGASPEA